MDIYRVVFSLLILSYACYSDIRERRVSNIVWVVMASGGISFAGYSAIVQGVSLLILIISSVIIIGVMSYILFRLGLFGAADAKALICIALLFPTQPTFNIFFYKFPLFDAFVPIVFPFAIMVLLNASVLALVVPISLFLRNLHSLGLRGFMRNAALCFVAYRVEIDGLGSGRFGRLTHAYEEIGGHLTRRYSLGGMPINNKTVQELKAYHGEQKAGTQAWVTPELPFVLFITLGFIAGCFIGL